MDRPDVNDVIRILGLAPLEGEGGMWSKVYASDEIVRAGEFAGRDTDRALFGTIHFLLTPSSFSCMHRLPTDEVWYHHSGPAVKMLLIYEDGQCEVRLLGQDLLRGERPQICVRRGTWQGAMIDPDSLSDYTTRITALRAESDASESFNIYTLMSTSMAPEYQDSDFTVGTFEELCKYVSDEHLGLLRSLTAEPVYK